MSSKDATFGILSAIGAPFFMALGFIIWDITWKKIGGSAFSLNLFKCNIASVGFLIACFVFSFEDGSTTTAATAADNNDAGADGSVWTVETVGFLILSGFVGIIIGDLAWLQALRLLGATRVLVVDTVKPFSAGVLGWWILGEEIGFAFFGIALTALGVLIVSFEKERGKDACDDSGDNGRGGDGNRGTPDDFDGEILQNSIDGNDGDNHKHDGERLNQIQGYLLALANVLLDTYGSILTKQHGKGMSTWAINLIRFGSAGFLMLLLSLVMHLRHRFQSSFSRNCCVSNDDGRIDPDGVTEAVEPLTTTSTIPWYTLPKAGKQDWSKVLTGTLFVTFLCPALSNYALFKIALALAITLGSITPLYALLLEWPIAKKRPTARSTIGATFAVGGVIFLSIWSV